MQKKNIYRLILITALVIAGCAGQIRYTQSPPEAKGFHPEGIAVLSMVANGIPDAQGKGEQILAEALARKGWFKKVEKPDRIKSFCEKDRNFDKTVSDFLEKLSTVNFPDPDLSKRIGETCGVQALMVGKIDLWNYSVEGGKKFAKVGMEIKLISTDTGKVMWRANHNKIEDYLVLKPDLARMAKNLVNDMIPYMPR